MEWSVVQMSDAAVLCALLGWQAAALKHGGQALQCPFCYRCIPLCAGKPSDKTADGKAATDDSAFAALRRLNLVDQHALYCCLLQDEGAWVKLLRLTPGIQQQQSPPETHKVTE